MEIQAEDLVVSIAKKRPSILIVDDTIQNLQLVVNILKQEDYEILIANNGIEALDFIKDVKPDLILLDIMMPEMDGYEVCRILKSSEETEDIPVIFLTAMTASEDIVKGFQLGGVDYLTKPFNKDELLVRVKTHLDLKSSRDLILEQNDKLKDLNEEKNHFLSIAAHDLKNPLNGIYGYAQILEMTDEKEVDVPEIIYLAKKIKRGIKNMVHIINDLLDINAIEEGKLKIKSMNFDLKKLINEIVANNQSSAIDKQIKIHFDAEENDYQINADRLKTQQIFDNLISNAIKFSPFEKNVWVKLEKTVVKGKVALRTSIKDEGPGIGDDEKPKLFKRFAKISNKPTNKESSSGLGLSIVKQFTELMNGTVWCESEFGKGATFIVEFYLPQ